MQLDDDTAAVVYDLDGTLVQLAVDWEAALDDVRAVYSRADIDTENRSLWELLISADDHGLTDEVEAAIAAHERTGAERSIRLQSANDLPLPVDVGVCTLNCEAACRIALDTHDLLQFVDAIVGRDTIPTQKPDPEALLATIRRMSADPSRTLFIGDTERDAVTAERAGVAFRYVDDTG